ncbi:MAG: hypothetical protein ACI8ZN_000374 [Bacteroidia bacterium]|jgi:hypothetical protein
MRIPFRSILIILIASHIGATAQTLQTDALVNDYQHPGRVNVNRGVMTIHSDVGLATSVFSKDMLFENYWSKELLANQMARLSGRNVAGIHSSSSIELQRLGKKDYSFWGLKLQHDIVLGSRYNSDLLRLAMEGNAANAQTDLTKALNFQLIQTSNLELGFEKLNRSGKPSNLYWGIGLVMGHAYSNYQIKTGKLTTNKDGEYIDATDVSFKFQQSSFGVGPSLGAATSFGYKWAQSSQNHLAFRINNVGFVRWQELETIVNAGSDYHYEGFNLTNVVARGGSVDFQDSLNSQYIITSKNAEIRPTPFSAAFNFNHSLENSNSIDLEMKYFYVPGFLPRLTAQYEQQFAGSSSSRWFVGGVFGGFGNAALIFGTDLKINDSAGIALKVSGIESLASNNLPIYWLGDVSLFIDL